MVLVADLDDAARRYELEYGLLASAGGEHVGLGTANVIVPLGRDYIELITITDRGTAAANPLGRYLSQLLSTRGEGIAAVCLRTADPYEVAERTGSRLAPMSRKRPDGLDLKWEILGMEGALTEGLPFFITWPLDANHPAQTPAHHPSGANGIAWVELGGDPERVRAWLGSDEAQLRVVNAEPGPRRFAVRTPAGEVLLR